jgi:hypothetical protein
MEDVSPRTRTPTVTDQKSACGPSDDSSPLPQKERSRHQTRATTFADKKSTRRPSDDRSSVPEKEKGKRLTQATTVNDRRSKRHRSGRPSDDHRTIDASDSHDEVGKDITDQREAWECAINRLALHTPYDNRDFAAATLSSKNQGASNTIFRVLHGQNLEGLLHISSTNDIESDDENIEQIEDDALGSDESDAGLEEINAGFQLSLTDKKAYDEFGSSTIYREHCTDRELQNRTASGIACGNGAHAVFVCPCPTCEDTFGVNYRVYKFYTHMEHPKH